MSINARRRSVVPDLFHVKRTFFDLRNDSSGKTLKTEVCGTYTDLDVATAATKRRLFDEGFTKESLAKFEENTLVDGQWKHPPEVLIHAETADGNVIEFVLETSPNMLGLRGANGRVEEDLYYVLQTKISYEKDPTGGIRTTDIKGVYLSRQQAVIAARRLLLDYHGRTWYKNYEEVTTEKDDGTAEGDVIVRAVGPLGEEYIISVVHES
jgi:hypothetical protein